MLSKCLIIYLPHGTLILLRGELSVQVKERGEEQLIDSSTLCVVYIHHSLWLVIVVQLWLMLSWTQILIAQITQVCKEICTKLRNKHKPIHSVNDKKVQKNTHPSCPSSNNSDLEDTCDKDHLGGTYSEHSIEYLCSPNNPDNPEHVRATLP